MDSTAAIDRAWRRWAETQGIELARVLPFAHGRRTVDVIAALAPELPAAAQAADVERALAADPGLTPIAGAREVLAQLSHDRVGVVTSGLRDATLGRLQSAGLPLPAVLISAEDVSVGKPDPAGYRLGARHLGYPAAQCMVVEDSPAGVDAARAAGMLAVGLTTTHTAEQLTAADAIIDTLAEMPELVASIAPDSPLFVPAR